MGFPSLKHVAEADEDLAQDEIESCRVSLFFYFQLLPSCEDEPIKVFRKQKS